MLRLGATPFAIAARMNPQGEEPEVVSCAGGCDASVDSLAEAVKEGWDRLTHNPSGLSWSWLGVCPSCLAAEAAKDTPKPEPKPKATTLVPVD